MYSKNPNEESDFISGFRENANQGEWEQRLTDSYGLILSLDGEGVISIDSGTLTLGPGSLVLLKPVLKHTFRIRNSWSYLWFHFLPRPHISRELEWPELIPGVGMTVLSPAELETVRKELEEAHKLEYQRPNGWNALAYLLAESAIVRGYCRIASELLDTDSRIRLAQGLLMETAESMDRIAARCGLSRATLYAKFRRETGISPRQYREYALLRRAARLLECSGLPVAEIAEQIGMPDPYYFSTRFRKFFGLSPRGYRRRKSSVSGG